MEPGLLEQRRIVMGKKNTVTLVKCPGCSLEFPESDLSAQIAHMEQSHPEIIIQRLRDAGMHDQVPRVMEELGEKSR